MKKAQDNIEYSRANGRKQSDKAAKEYREENKSTFKKGEHACHKTDQCAGGDPTDISGPGDGGINSSFGSQNKAQQEKIMEQLKEVSDQDKNLKVRVIIEDKVY